MIDRLLLIIVAGQIVASSILFGGVHLWVWSLILLASWAALLLLASDLLISHRDLPIPVAVVIALAGWIGYLLWQLSTSTPFTVVTPQHLHGCLDKLAAAGEFSSATSTYHCRLTLYQWLIPLITLLVVRYALRSSRELRLLGNIIVVVATVQAIYGISQYLCVDEPLSFFALWYKEGKVGGTYVCRNSYACFLAMGVAAAGALLLATFFSAFPEAQLSDILPGLLHCRQLPWLVAYLAAIILMALAVYLSLSRAGLLCSVLAVAVLAFGCYWHRRRQRSLLRLVVTILLLGLPVVIYLYLIGIDPLLDRFAKLPTDTSRWDLARVTLSMIANHLWTGVGGGNFGHFAEIYTHPDWPYPAYYAHNDYLQFVAEYGIIGACLFLTFIVTWLVTVFRQFNRSRSLRWLKWGAIAALMVIGAHGIVDFSLHIPGHRLLVATFMAILMAPITSSQPGRTMHSKSKRYTIWIGKWMLLLGALTGTIWVGSDLYRINQAEYDKPCCDYRFYQHVDKQIVRLDPDRQIQFLKDCLAGYRLARHWQSDNFEIWQEIGYLYFKLAGITSGAQRQNEMAAKAVQAYCRANRLMPAAYSPYYYLAIIYLQQSKFDAADQAMASARIVAPYNIPLAVSMSRFWIKRWQHQARPEYLVLIADRFYLLNQLQFARHREWTFAIWEYLAPYWLNSRDPWWGTIIPQREDYSLWSVRYFLRRQKPKLARQFLPYLSGLNAEIHSGHVALDLGQLPQALAHYHRAVIAADSVAKSKIVKAAITHLAKHGQIEAGMTFLQSSHWDSRRLREILFAGALRTKFAPQRLLELLQHTRAKFTTGDGQLAFLTARTCCRLGEPEQALGHAEEAVRKAPGNSQYTWLYLNLLWQLQMPQLIAAHLRIYGHRLSQPAQFYHWLARQYLQQKENAKAREAARRAIDLDPNNPELQKFWRQISFNNR